MDSTKQNVGKIVITALFAALACVATMIIKVPTVGTNGYVNIGDTIVLLSAWMIGGSLWSPCSRYRFSPFRFYQRLRKLCTGNICN